MLNSNLLPHSLASSCIPRTFQEPFPEILLLLPEILEASSCASEPQFFTAMSHISSFKSHVNLMQIASNVTSLFLLIHLSFLRFFPQMQKEMSSFFSLQDGLVTHTLGTNKKTNNTLKQDRGVTNIFISTLSCYHGHIVFIENGVFSRTLYTTLK